MNRIKAVIAGLVIAVAIGCSGAANPMVGTWKLDLAAEAKQKMPEGMKVPEMTMTFNADGTFSGSATGLGPEDSTVEGTYTLEGKNLKMTLTKENGKEPSSSRKEESATLSEDMKSFDVPGSDGMGKMVKQ